ncbi:hypothetical protein C8R45DRAFT_1003211 [Mycena sanguinolenta]|nr:hypothetical protein C8R45DRAFT_1003211 [Mycena sanguinolenta]
MEVERPRGCFRPCEWTWSTVYDTTQFPQSNRNSPSVIRILPCSKALSFAIVQWKETAFDELVAAGGSVDGKFGFKYGRCSFLHIAAGTRDSELPKLMCMPETLESPRAFECDGNGRSALDYGVSEGHMESSDCLPPRSPCLALASLSDCERLSQS